MMRAMLWLMVLSCQAIVGTRGQPLPGMGVVGLGAAAAAVRWRLSGMMSVRLLAGARRYGVWGRGPEANPRTAARTFWPTLGPPRWYSSTRVLMVLGRMLACDVLARMTTAAAVCLKRKKRGKLKRLC